MDTHVKEGQLYVQHQKFGKKWKKSWFVLYPASQNGIARLEFFDCSSASDKPNTKKLDKKIIRLSECISILPAVTETCPKDNMAAFCVETNDKTHVFATEKQASAEWVEKMCEIAFQGGGVPDHNGQQELQMAENLIYYSREEGGVPDHNGQQELQMAENLIYYSREEGALFRGGGESGLRADAPRSVGPVSTAAQGRGLLLGDVTSCVTPGRASSLSTQAVNEFWVSVQRTEASERRGLQGTYWLKAWS
ncbi:hypothetical protein AAFF_G00261670 [Aldrovandia affinis]|uniref:PH domain-containing protein n=1 Tax=Aldrovandia affinis TaxID=143900 RepID=A0AAD7W2U4_9TELE|nr:hypothetical protein AAFF_G00261670 [Aldrovandia affinis]